MFSVWGACCSHLEAAQYKTNLLYWSLSVWHRDLGPARWLFGVVVRKKTWLCCFELFEMFVVEEKKNWTHTVSSSAFHYAALLLLLLVSFIFSFRFLLVSPRYHFCTHSTLLLFFFSATPSLPGNLLRFPSLIPLTLHTLSSPSSPALTFLNTLIECN